MGQADHYIHGTNNVICDRCGFKYKATQVKEEWTGLIVCEKCFDSRHPQDFIRAKHDNQRGEVNRTEQTDSFLSAGEITLADF